MVTILVALMNIATCAIKTSNSAPCHTDMECEQWAYDQAMENALKHDFHPDSISLYLR
jgi:hypothetical protein